MRFRAAAEALLTDRKIPKTTIFKEKRRVWLNLHSRIDKFKKVAPDSADYLFAMKWIGNTGNHPRESRAG